jgi:sulfonate transport system substrate-binding protein
MDNKPRCHWRPNSSVLALATVLALLLVACPADDPAVEPDPDDPDAVDPAEEEPAPDDDLEDLEEVSAGYVSGVDQMGLPAALDLGFFEDHGLDVEIVDPFPTGVDALNALEAGEVQFTQVGTPSFGAILGGMDVVYLGNYSGSAVQRGIDETMAVVAHPESGIDPDDLTTVQGTRIGVSVGSINHLYVLGMLNSVELTPDDVELVNLPPPEMPVALETQSVDAISIWDPWPIIALNDVEGAVQVSRGDGFLAYIGYIVALRDFVEENPDIVERFLAARAEADLWVRENPEEAADIVVRWFPGTDPDVALDAMEFNVRQIDPRMSACNYLAAHTNLELLSDLDVIDDIYDVNDHFDVRHIHRVLEGNPELVEDLEPIPAEAEIEDPETYVFDPAEAEAACPE